MTYSIPKNRILGQMVQKLETAQKLTRWSTLQFLECEVGLIFVFPFSFFAFHFSFFCFSFFVFRFSFFAYRFFLSEERNNSVGTWQTEKKKNTSLLIFMVYSSL